MYTNNVEDCFQQGTYDAIWIVTYWDFDDNHMLKEPVVTAFDNYENAMKCYQELKKYHDGCCFDATYLYSRFSSHTG